MAVKNRKSNSPNTTSSVIEKSKKSMRKAKKDMDNTSLITNKYGALLGLLIIFFGIIYLILFGRYIYKRSTGQTTSALKNENPLNVENLDMEAFKKAIKIDENGKITFTKEDLEKYKNVYVDVNGNAQIPPKEDENIEEIRNEESDDQSGANVKVEETAANESKLRQKRSLNMAGNNAPDEIGEMSDYLSNLLTSGPSANFVIFSVIKLLSLTHSVVIMVQFNLLALLVLIFVIVVVLINIYLRVEVITTLKKFVII